MAARRPTFKPSLRDQRLLNNRYDAFYAAMSGKEPQAQNVVAEKRKYTPSGERSEADVNADLRGYFDERTDIQIWRNNRGTVQNAHGGWIRYGVGPNGASDWIGYRIVTITADMVGKRMAQFAAVEAKRPGGKPDEAQSRFVAAVLEDGGAAGVADSVGQAQKILGG